MRRFFGQLGFGAGMPEPPEKALERKKSETLAEAKRVFDAVDRGEFPDTDLPLGDDYYDFGIDKIAACRYAEMVVGNANSGKLEALSRAFPFGREDVKEGVVEALVNAFQRGAENINLIGIENERVDEAVFSDERVRAAFLKYVDLIVARNKDAFDRNHNVANMSVNRSRRSELSDYLTKFIGYMPAVANAAFLRLADSAGEDQVRIMLERMNVRNLRGRLSAELATKLQTGRRNFPDGILISLFTGLTKEHLGDVRGAICHVSAFEPDVQNWMVHAYLFGYEYAEGEDKEERDRILASELPEMPSLDRSALAVMRLRGFAVDEDWAAKLPSRGEGVDALLEILADKTVPDAIKKSAVFIDAMSKDVIEAALDGKPVSANLVRAAALSRKAYKTTPGTLFDIVAGDPTFLDAPADDDRTGPAVVALMRRDAAAEKADNLVSSWGWVDADSPEVAGNTTGQIADRLEWLGTQFGWSAALRFLNRSNVDVHDATGCVDSLKRFFAQRADQSPKEMVTLLDQVTRDDVSYDGRPSQVQLRIVLEMIGDARIEDILALVERLNLPSFVERMAKLRDDARFHPYKTWKGMKEFAAVVDFLNKNKTLERLADSDAPESTKRFGHALLEHPGVPAADVLRFLTDAPGFLSASATYATDSVHERMAPINLAGVERLGLTASEVRDAIADGSLDRLQVLPAFERTFAFDARGTDPFSAESLQSSLLKALGRRERDAMDAPEGGAGALKPKARDVKKLFASVQAILDLHGIDRENRKPWLLGEAAMVPAYWTEPLARDLHAAVYDKKIGIDAPATFEVRARIGKKSDPSLIVAGNDTASCMPFGDGKTNVYAWSPACAQMVVERRLTDGTWRTMAQSVVMPTLAGDAPAPGRFARLLAEEKVRGVFDAAEFARPSVILCDNVEPNKNDVDEGRMPVIEAAYRAFFREYLSRHASDIGVDPTRVVIGKEDYLGHDRLTFPKTANVFVPLAPISYTDNNAVESFVIETGLDGTSRRPPLTPPAYQEGEHGGRTGIRDATGADILAMAYLEGKGFADNARMMFGLYDRQQRVTAALISREQHGDPALTLISRDDKGEPVGYMLAYVGHTSDVPEAFIDDFAVDRSKGLAAMRYASRLLEAFLDRYVAHYDSRNEPFPSIFAQMREATSYKLLTGQLRTLSEKRGLRVEIEEEGIGSLGGEPMHHVRLFIGKTDADVAAARDRWNGRVEKPTEEVVGRAWDNAEEYGQDTTDDQWGGDQGWNDDF